MKKLKLPNNYINYISDYLEEATEEMNRYIKEATYKENYYLRDHIQIPYISQVLKKPINQDEIIKFTGEFIDSHSLALGTSGPVHMFIFGPREMAPIYTLFNITEKDIIEHSKKMFEETFEGMGNFQIVKEAPQKILLISILIEAIQKKYDDIVTCIKYLMAFSEYPILYRKFWKYSVKEDVMNYTIEHLPNKFKIKKMNNILELLKHDIDSSTDFWTDKLSSGQDHTYINFIYRVRNQIKNTFKNIAVQYYDNYERNATQHTREGQAEDGTIIDQEGHTSNISISVENTFTKITSNDLIKGKVLIAAEGVKVDHSILMGFLNQIKTSNSNMMYKFIENIITLYFSKKQSNLSLGSGEFLSFGLALYRSIGISKNPMHKEIRSVLDYWMNNIVDIRKYYQRADTIIRYTRAIFNYMIFMIHYYN
jgi:hypothetical protein